MMRSPAESEERIATLILNCNASYLYGAMQAILLAMVSLGARRPTIEIAT